MEKNKTIVEKGSPIWPFLTLGCRLWILDLFPLVQNKKEGSFSNRKRGEYGVYIYSTETEHAQTHEQHTHKGDQRPMNTSLAKGFLFKGNLWERCQSKCTVKYTGSGLLTTIPLVMAHTPTVSQGSRWEGEGQRGAEGECEQDKQRKKRSMG